MIKIRKVGEYSFGFTLVELLVVLVIVGVLAGLLFSVSDGIFGRGQRGRAQSELEAIRVALEAYRARFGDYPEVVTSSQFFQALEGKVGPKGNLLTPPYPPFLVAGDFSLRGEETPELLDPFRRLQVPGRPVETSRNANTPKEERV